MIDWSESPEVIAAELAPVDQLHAEADLLRQIEYWRSAYEKLAYDKRWRIARWKREQKDDKG